MFLTRFGLSRPIVVRMALIIIVVIGIYSYRSMPRFLDPDITIGEGLIVTVCPGFSPEEMENLVTKKIEDQLEGISEIRRYESDSYEGTSKIHVYFNTRLSEYGIDQAMQDSLGGPWFNGIYDAFSIRWTPVAGAAWYEVRFSLVPITLENWDRCLVVDEIAAPAESADVFVQPEVFSNTCISCGLCEDVCPHDAIVLPKRA